MTETVKVTKAGLARRLNVSRSRIGQLVKKGLPVEPDGKLDLDRALGWVREHASTHSVVLGAAQSRAIEAGPYSFGREIPDPFARGATLAAVATAYRAPGLAAVIAASAGASASMCFALFHGLAGAMAFEAETVLDEMRVKRPAAIWDDSLPAVDWPKFAAAYGQVFDQAEAAVLLARLAEPEAADAFGAGQAKH